MLVSLAGYKKTCNKSVGDARKKGEQKSGPPNQSRLTGLGRIGSSEQRLSDANEMKAGG